MDGGCEVEFIGSTTYAEGSVEAQSGLDPQTRLPNTAPGSIEHLATYRAAMDPRLTGDERKAAAAADAAARQAEMDAAALVLNETHQAPPGWVIVRGPVGASA